MTNSIESYKKVCGKCNRLLDLNLFYKDNRAKSGTQVNCKKCHQKYYLDNRQKYTSLKKDNPKYKESLTKYFLNNKDNINEYKRRRYATEEGKAKVKSVNQNRRCKKVTTSDGTVNSDFILSLLKKQNYKCAISGMDISNGYHIDHIVPLSKGGTHTSGNIQLLYPSVNMSKKDKIL